MKKGGKGGVLMQGTQPMTAMFPNQPMTGGKSVNDGATRDGCAPTPRSLGPRTA